MRQCSRCKQVKSLKEFHKCSKNALGIQYHCKVCGKEMRREYIKAHPDRIKETNANTRKKLGPGYWRKKHQQFKLEMLEAFGKVCECCGETEITFLTLDHIHGGGAKHRKAVGQAKILRQLRDAGWPKEGYRILCMNCQFGYMHGRTCPHQLKKTPTLFD